MVDLTVGLICRLTSANSSQAMFILKAGEIAGIALIAVPIAFVIPAVLKLRRVLLEEREAAEELIVSRPKPVRPRPARSRS